MMELDVKVLKSLSFKVGSLKRDMYKPKFAGAEPLAIASVTYYDSMHGIKCTSRDQFSYNFNSFHVRIRSMSWISLQDFPLPSYQMCHKSKLHNEITASTIQRIFIAVFMRRDQMFSKKVSQNATLATTYGSLKTKMLRRRQTPKFQTQR